MIEKSVLWSVVLYEIFLVSFKFFHSNSVGKNHVGSSDKKQNHVWKKSFEFENYCTYKTQILNR